VKRSWLSAFPIAIVLTFVIVALVWTAIVQRVPSPADCADLWNRPTNEIAQRSVIGYSKVSVSGWESKAGAYCSAMFFDRVGTPWQTYALWLADPHGQPSAYGPDIGGTSYGSGWYFEAGGPHRSNATIDRDGRLDIIG
jgi:hypothetical protein